MFFVRGKFSVIQAKFIKKLLKKPEKIIKDIQFERDRYTFKYVKAHM